MFLKMLGPMAGPKISLGAGDIAEFNETDAKALLAKDSGGPWAIVATAAEHEKFQQRQQQLKSLIESAARGGI